MADITSSKYLSGPAGLSRGMDAPVRVITLDVDFEKDFTSTADTDVIFLGELPAGTTVIAGWMYQVTPAATTDSNTVKLALEDKSDNATDLTSTLADTAAAGTWVVNALAAPFTCDEAHDVTLISAAGQRTDGKVQVQLIVVEGRAPTFPAQVDRNLLA
jgi:hypothetical protein